MTHDSSPGSPTLRWLGQAGFLLETMDLRLAFDPYLSDECERIYGLVRSDVAPVTPEGLRVDVVLVSHWHEDHFDLPTIGAVLASGGVVVGPPSVAARIRGALGDRGAAVVSAIPGKRIALGAASVVPVRVCHRVAGYLTEDAVGYVVEVQGVTVFHSGDTDYTRGIVDSLPFPIDAAMLCINGTGGNMNVIEAAVLAAQLDVRLLVPMHFGMWAPEAYGPDATLDPEAFASACQGLSVRGAVHVPELDVPFLIRRAAS